MKTSFLGCKIVLKWVEGTNLELSMSIFSPQTVHTFLGCKHIKMSIKSYQISKGEYWFTPLSHCCATMWTNKNPNQYPNLLNTGSSIYFWPLWNCSMTSLDKVSSIFKPWINFPTLWLSKEVYSFYLGQLAQKWQVNTVHLLKALRNENWLNFWK